MEYNSSKTLSILHREKANYIFCTNINQKIYLSLFTTDLLLKGLYRNCKFYVLIIFPLHPFRSKDLLKFNMQFLLQNEYKPYVLLQRSCEQKELQENKKTQLFSNKNSASLVYGLYVVLQLGIIHLNLAQLQYKTRPIDQSCSIFKRADIFSVFLTTPLTLVLLYPPVNFLLNAHISAILK